MIKLKNVTCVPSGELDYLLRIHELMICRCVQSQTWGTALRRVQGDEVTLVWESFRLSAGSHVSLRCERTGRFGRGVSGKKSDRVSNR